MLVPFDCMDQKQTNLDGIPSELCVVVIFLKILDLDQLLTIFLDSLDFLLQNL